ncbi:MAG: RNA polymerase factor sigma-54 [Zoogloeaceae bacterium]|nr:RNA polymerase factor sigma-54 [Zoogloeaceae bacterium]
MKPSLQLKISQQLALTPQLQQSIKLLQISTLEMNQEIERYLLENPLLEREEETPAPQNDPFPRAILSGGANETRTSESETFHEEDERPSGEFSAAEMEEERWFQDGGSYGYEGRGGSRDREDEDVEAQDLQPAATCLRDHLLDQLSLSQFSERDKALIRFLIEALDEDGYLSASLEELYATLPPEYEIEAEELKIALKQLQSLDPAGVGARDLKESLALQIQARSTEAEPAAGNDAAREAKVRALALRIIDRHLELLASRDFGKIRKQISCDEALFREAHQLIVSLEPRPGARFAALDTRYIIPDVLVRKARGRWAAQINPDAFPRLRVNRLYADILTRQRRGESALSAQLQEARWLIKNVRQRFDTICRVTQAIVDRQEQFFEHGEVGMRPLVLREIADEVELHESTVSRVTSQKYMSTPRGIFELKYFFGSHVATDTGGACSATAIRALIKQMVGGENGKKPLSDGRISEILGQQGIVVARRTVAKYREACGIPSVSQRRTL